MGFLKVISGGGGYLAHGAMTLMFLELLYLRDHMKCSMSFPKEGFSSTIRNNG